MSAQWKEDKRMSDNSGILGEILEQGASAVKQTVKQVVKTPSDLAKAAGKQVIPLRQGSAGQAGSDQVQPSDKTTDEKIKTKEFVEELYKPSEKTELNKKGSVQKPPEETEEQKIEKLRQELHANYYRDLTYRPKASEEKPAEKVEREKKEERWELQEKEKKKPPPLAVQRGAQKTEKFPGASG